MTEFHRFNFVTKSGVYDNAVDFILAMFPTGNSPTSNEEASVTDGPIQIKQEIEDVATMPEVNQSIQVKKEAGEDGVLEAEHSIEPKEDEGLQFDSNLGATYGFTELNVCFIPKNRSFIFPQNLTFLWIFKWKGYRWYPLGEAMVCLKPDDIKTLKIMENTVALDSKFVSTLLSAVFDDEVLKESSAGGHKSNYNDVVHKALDGKKLKFIKGIFLYIK